jgi:hypothetical protein
MQDKTRLYLDAGAEEIWICDEDGRGGFMEDWGKWTVRGWCRDFLGRWTQIEL